MTAPQIVQSDATDATTWHRLHPLSPMIRGWAAMLAVMGVLINLWADNLFNASDQDDTLKPDSANIFTDFIAYLDTLPMWGLLVLISVCAAFVVVLYSLYIWWFERYQLSEHHVSLRKGLFFRSERQARLDRVHALDIRRPILPRIFGLAELSFEVADAGQSSIVLRYLKLEHARRLRKELLRDSQESQETVAGTDSEVSSDDTEGDLLLRVPVKRMLLAQLFTLSTFFVVILGFFLIFLIISRPQDIGIIMAFSAPFIGALPEIFKSIDRSWRFTVTRVPEGLRLRYGLFNKTSQTVPVKRVQAVGVYRPLLWRWFKWSLVHVNVAGYGDTFEEIMSAKTVLMPVGTDADLLRIFVRGLAFSSAENMRDLVVEGLMGDADDTSRFACAPAHARWVSPMVRRRHGYVVTDDVLLSRGGRLYRSCVVTPHHKVQSLRISSGPLQGVLGLASVELLSTPGLVRASVRHMGMAEARRFVYDQSRRCEFAVREHHQRYVDQPPQDHGGPEDFNDEHGGIGASQDIPKVGGLGQAGAQP